MFLAEQTAALVPVVYRELAESNAWSLLAPEIAVAALSLLALFDGMFNRSRDKRLFSITLKLAFILLGTFLISQLFADRSPEGVSFGGLIVQYGWYTDVARLFFIGTAFAVVHLASGYLSKTRLGGNEFHHLTLVSVAAMMLLVQANHFVLFFIALETVAVTLYVLVGYNKNNAFSLEAGVKYLIAGALGSALLLAGIVLLYGLGGNTMINTDAGSLDMLRFDHLQVFLARSEVTDLPLVKAGVILTLCGVAFKIGAFPFNLWIPDVYQGAPTPSTAFLTIGSKAVGVFALLGLTVLSRGPFVHMQEMLVSILVPVAVLTLLFGNITALGQLNVKRLLGLSSISHAGFLLIGVIAAIATDDESARFLALGAILFYLFVYLLSSLLVFGVVNQVSEDRDATASITDYRRLYARSPFLAFVLAIGVGSLAGLPPTLGFVAKLFILIAAFKAGLFGLVTFALISVVLGIYYYSGWLREAFARVTTDDPVEPIAVGWRSRIILTAAGTLVLLGFLVQLIG